MAEMSCIAALTVVVAIASMGYLGQHTSDTFTETCLAIHRSSLSLGARGKPDGRQQPCGVKGRQLGARGYARTGRRLLKQSTQTDKSSELKQPQKESIKLSARSIPSPE